MSSSPETYDAIVVGSGPSGAMAALELARARRRVLILEKARLPRYKTCGGGLLQRSLIRLPPEISDVIEARSFSAELHHHAPPHSFHCTRSEPIVSMVMRDRFDHRLVTLAMAAGAELQDAAAVTTVALERDRIHVGIESGTRFSARYIIAADGANSTVARLLGSAPLPSLVPALEVEAVFDASIHARHANSARFDLGLTPYGYGWLFAKENLLSLGVLTTRRGACNLHQEYARYTTALGLPPPRSEERHGYVIPLQPRPDLFAQKRVLLTGDAAGLADPVIAEGISAALMSGQLAARAVADRASDDGAAGERYRVALQPWLSELRAARFLASCLYQRPRLRAWILRRRGQSLSEYVTDVVTGKSSYRSALSRPLNYLRLLLAR